ncbi:MAG: transposase [Candidatus Riflebacteria bacterium]|nr:transposase [Candidatus Riflebacteria bacterium]
MRTTTVDAVEFIRRFLLHVFPKGFVRIRSYGFMANRGRHASLELCRRLLQESPARKDSPPEEDPDLDEEGTATDDEVPEKTIPSRPWADDGSRGGRRCAQVYPAHHQRVGRVGSLRNLTWRVICCIIN